MRFRRSSFATIEQVDYNYFGGSLTVIKMDLKKVSSSRPLGTLRLITVAVIVAQLQGSCSVVGNVIIPSDTKLDSSVTNNNTASSDLVITTLAPSITEKLGSTSEMQSKLTTAGEEARRTTLKPLIGMNPIYSSLREKDADLPESCADYEVKQLSHIIHIKSSLKLWFPRILYLSGNQNRLCTFD